MKLPSIAYIAERSLQTFARFPFALLSAVIGTAAVLLLAQEEFNVHHPYPWLYTTAAIGFLGISLLTFAQYWAERFSLGFRHWLMLHAAVVAVLAAYWYLLPANIFEPPENHVIRLFTFAIAAHLFVAVGPFLGHGSVGDFWEFNKTLLLRVVSAGLYAGVLYIGLTIALLAIDNLFDAGIRPIRYLQLWWFLVGIFATWFFLSGAPLLSDLPERRGVYPKGLKAFVQYVLVPLVTVYLAILYAYMAKITVEWDWPQGWVGYLVLGFSISGMFTLLLLHPIKDMLANRWMALVTDRFYLVILPPSVLLLLAIWRRISEYGLTENRYFVVVLGLWIIGISLYLLLSRTKNIKAIPLTIGILALVCSVGPWSAQSVSRWNQTGRLQAVLEANNLFADGRVVRAGSPVPYEEARRISSVIRYLLDVHGTEALQPWFSVSLDSMAAASETVRGRTDDVTRMLVVSFGVEYVPAYRTRADGKGERYTFQSSVTSVDIDGYEGFRAGEELGEQRTETVFTAGGGEWKASLDRDNEEIRVYRREGGEDAGDPAGLLIGPMIRSLVPERAVAFRSVTVGGDSLLVSGRSRSVEATALIRRLVLERDSSRVRVSSVTFDLLVRD